jgi:hypothetical protein
VSPEPHLPGAGFVALASDSRRAPRKRMALGFMNIFRDEAPKILNKPKDFKAAL